MLIGEESQCKEGEEESQNIGQVYRAVWVPFATAFGCSEKKPFGRRKVLKLSLWPHAERVKTVCLKPEKRSALLNTVKRPVKIVLSEQFSSNNIHVQKATQ